ncbi:MAG: flagellar basal-body MS-ring/collar protein FliF [Pseudomonadota bacterium]
MAESSSTELAIADDVVDKPLAEAPRNIVIDTLSNTETIRQITLVVTLVLCITIAFFIFLWSKEPTYRPLAYMPPDEMIEVLDYLDQSQTTYKLDGKTILVVDKEFNDIKSRLARAGIQTADDGVNDIIMQDMGFGVSQRLEAERLTHAREQQIARTIEKINAVAKATVLLALPKENVFARRSKPATATVVVTARRGVILKGEEVDAIVDIVASAVQSMEPSNVTVTDNNGRLLNSGSQDSVSARARKEYELEKKREDEYLRKIDSILIPVLGLGNYTAQVDVSMDFTTVEQTQKRFNPDLPAVRSEMVSESNSTGNIIAGVPGALTNQPPLDSNIPENAGGDGASPVVPGSSAKEQVLNYELDSTISHTKQQTGIIRRLSVSVAVDHISSTTPEGEAQSTALSQQELLNIRRLLQGGIGFDVTRGDSLEVVSIPFNRLDLGEVADTPIWEQPFFMPMVKLVMGGLVIIVLILTVIRPMLKRLIFPDAPTEEELEENSLELDLGDETIDLLSDEFDESQVGFAADGSLQLPNLHKDEDVLKAVRALVSNEPELSAQVVRGWLLEDE